MLAPPAKSTNELLHIVLLIGNIKLHSKPIAIEKTPADNIKTVFFDGVIFGRSVFKKVPVNTPRRAEHIAGIVLRSPSGS